MSPVELQPSGTPAAVTALASSLHLAFALLRYHGNQPGAIRLLLCAGSGAFALLPWFAPSATAIGIGLAVHLAFFLVTDRIGRSSPPVARPATASAASRTPSPSTSAPPAAKGPVAATPSPRTELAVRERPSGFVPLHVLDLLDETPDIRTFRLARPAGFDFAPGQFLAVRVRVDGKEHARCYSISSPPSASGYLEISIKKQGLVSTALHATLRPGATLHVRPPAGAFVYPADDDRPLVLIAGGVGITPLISMARHAVTADPGRPVVLVQSARTLDDLAFASELGVLQRRHPRLQWVPAVTNGSVNGQYYAGRIDGTLLRMAVPDIAGAIVYLCGPTGMIQDLRGQLVGMGLASNQVRFERFEAAIAAVGAERAERTLAAAPMVAAPTSAMSITFAHSQVSHAAHAGDTVLDAAEACGVEIPTLCRAGVCGTCRTRLVEGDVECVSTALDPGDRAAGFVLACVAQARTDCVVEA